MFLCLSQGHCHVDYAGGNPDPVARVENKQFAVVSMPPGASVPAEVDAAYYQTPREVQILVERALCGAAHQRPTAAEWKADLSPLATPVRTGVLQSFRSWAPGRAARLLGDRIQGNWRQLGAAALVAAAIYTASGRGAKTDGGASSPQKPGRAGIPPAPRKPADPELPNKVFLN